MPAFATLFASAHGLTPVRHVANAVSDGDTRLYADVIVRGVYETAYAAKRVADRTVTRSIPAKRSPPPLARNDLPVFLLKEAHFVFVQKLQYFF